VLGNGANAHYQGTTLGNLTGGATAAKLDKLVHKWFFGSRPSGCQLFGNYRDLCDRGGNAVWHGRAEIYRRASGAQSAIAIFVATLGETALRSPSSIQNMFIVNGDGTYGVRFYQNGTARWVTVDSQLPTYSGGYFLYANMGSRGE